MRQLFAAYFKKRIHLAAVLLGLLFLLYTALWLEGVGLQALWYPSLLFLAACLGLAFIDFYYFRRRFIALGCVKQHIDETLDRLPAPQDAIEESYQELLRTLMQRKQEELQALRSAQNATAEYVTIWAHQIKTPLTALSLLTGELPEKAQKEYAARLFEVEQYADMLLQYLRMESESTDYLFQKYSVRAMVHQSVKYFARIFISKQLTVKIDIPDEAVVVTDEKWMVFVLRQILSNALKYTQRGGITIDMPAADTIRITDTGIGISKEDLPRIFERGYTGFNGRLDKKATGLGLFLTKEILHRLNSSIEITSEEGVGTEVRIVTSNLTKV